jgi:multisubunit Na+/H+ antiporter MnhB subunit
MKPDRSIILDVSVRFIFHTALLFSIFLLFAGHNDPGGGFIGGLVAGAAFVLRFANGGVDEVHEVSAASSWTFLGAGLLVAVLTGMAGWVFGTAFLESEKFTANLPLIGEVYTTSALPFDIGVYLVVLGLVLAILETVGGEEGEPTPEDSSGDEQAEERR